MKKKEEVVKVNILDVLLDDDNTAPIIMYDDKDKPIKFEQVAVIPLDDELYCILKPVTKIKGIRDDEAVVFKVIQDYEKDAFLKVEESELIAIQVFSSYYTLIDKEIENNDMENILSVIKNDPNLQNVIDEKTNEIIDFTKMDLHPFRFQDELFVIIKHPEESFEESLVWQIIKHKNGEQKMVWVENEALENDIIKMYLRRQNNV